MKLLEVGRITGKNEEGRRNNTGRVASTVTQGDGADGGKEAVRMKEQGREKGANEQRKWEKRKKV